MTTQLFGMITSCAISLVDIYIAFSFFDGFIEKRAVKKPWNIAVVTGLWLALSIMSIYGKETPYLVLSMLGVNILIAICFYRDRMGIKVFSACLLICLAIIAEAMTYFAMIGLKQVSADMMKESLTLQVEGGIISKIIFLLIVKIIYSFRTAKSGDIPARFRAMLFLMPVASIIIIYQICISSISSMRMDLNTIMISIISVLYINIVTFILFEGFMKQAEDQLKLTLAKQQLSIQIAHYRNLQETRNEAKAIWHDMKNHLFCIEALVSKGSQADALNYVKKLNNSTKNLNNIVDTGNPVIDSIIEEKTIVSKRLGIKMQSEIMAPTNLWVDPIDICIILGNALDNAIEANDRLIKKDIEKIIKVKISCSDSYLTIGIENSSNPCNPDKDGIFRTSKNEKGVHGYGMQNIKNTLSKYNGNLVTSWADGIFSTNIVMIATTNPSETI